MNSLPQPKKKPTLRWILSLVELIGRYSKQASAWEELSRALRVVAKHEVRAPEGPRPIEQRHKLEQRLDSETMARLAADYEAGVSSNQLMRDYGLGKGSVLQLLRDAGVAMRGQSLAPADLDTAVALYVTGLSLLKVSEHFSVSVDAVRNAFIRNGVQMRPRRGWHYEA